MKRGQRRKFQEERAVRVPGVSRQREKSAEASSWPGERFRYLTAMGTALIVLCTVIIYAQTARVPAIDYEDSYYLLRNPYVNVTAAFSHLSAVWNEPYFANFHPLTTTTWLIDRALADKSKPFDALPFRITHLLYAVVGASLLIPLYRRLGLPTILAVLGALLYAVHPIHTEVVAWLSARKDLISLIFMALSFLAWLWARAAATPNQWRLRHALTILLVLLAVLSKPIAVILPVLFIAYEFCSEPHAGITCWRWAKRHSYPLLTRTLALTGIFLAVGGVCALIFHNLLPRDPMHGGWLIFVPIGLMPLMLAMAPPATELAAFRAENSAGGRVLGPPFAVLSVVFSAGSAWTFWAQGQVGAIKGGLTLLPTLNLTFDVMLAYAGKTLVPAYMRTCYTWSGYPYVEREGPARSGAGLRAGLDRHAPGGLAGPKPPAHCLRGFLVPDRFHPSIQPGADEHEDGRSLSVRAYRGSHSGAAGPRRRLVSCLPPQAIRAVRCTGVGRGLIYGRVIRARRSLVRQNYFVEGPSASRSEPVDERRGNGSRECFRAALAWPSYTCASIRRRPARRWCF